MPSTAAAEVEAAVRARKDEVINNGGFELVATRIRERVAASNCELPACDKEFVSELMQKRLTEIEIERELETNALPWDAELVEKKLAAAPPVAADKGHIDNPVS